MYLNYERVMQIFYYVSKKKRKSHQHLSVLLGLFL